MATLLIIEDNRSLAVALSAAAESIGLQTQMAPTLKSARSFLNEQTFNGILLDIGLPDGHGLDLIKQWQWQQKPEVAIITAHGEIENAISARKLGIAHFFDKPINFEELQTFFNSLCQPQVLPSPRKPQQPSPFVGAAPAMRSVFRKISHACASDQPVVISGALGTGKSHVAHMIRQASNRSHEAVTLQPSLLLGEPELTEAVLSAKGKILIIESVVALSPALQLSLVHTLDKLADKAPRLIVTTNDEGLLKHVKEGNVLHDLYMRLQVLEVSLPPLKERLDDLPAIANCFLGELAANASPRLDHAVIETLNNYDWPGNLRELRNVINHAIVASSGGPQITPAHLPAYLITPTSRRQTTDEDLSFGLKLWVDHELTAESNYKQISSKLENILLKILLDRFDGKPSHLASALSMNRSTLRKKLKGYDANES